MKVKFSRCNSNSLANVPQVDGQLIYVKDTSEVYMDVGNNRNKLSDVIEVADITNIQNPIISKIYYDEATENLYKYIDNEWKSLGGSATPQIYFWDGNQQQAGLDFWNNIYQLQKTQPCIVVHTERVFGAGTRYKTFVWHYYNNLPNGGGETTYSNIGSWDFNPYGTSSGFNVYTVIRASLYFTITNDAVTAIHYSTEVQNINYLDTLKNVAGNYVPQYNNSPANKKYVDDSISTYAPTSTSTTFDNTGTGLQATNVQDAIEELVQKINDLETTVGQVDAILDEITGE